MERDAPRGRGLRPRAGCVLDGHRGLAPHELAETLFDPRCVIRVEDLPDVLSFHAISGEVRGISRQQLDDVPPVSIRTHRSFGHGRRPRARPPVARAPPSLRRARPRHGRLAFRRRPFLGSLRSSPPVARVKRYLRAISAPSRSREPSFSRICGGPGPARQVIREQLRARRPTGEYPEIPKCQSPLPRNRSTSPPLASSHFGRLFSRSESSPHGAKVCSLPARATTSSSSPFCMIVLFLVDRLRAIIADRVVREALFVASQASTTPSTPG